MKILIGTKNPVKINGAKEAFEKYFQNVQIDGISVSSDVGEEPINDNIYLGAKNRVNNLIKYAKENNIDAEYFLGIEAGITNQLGKWIMVSIAVIKDKEGYESMGTSIGFPVPEKYVEEIISTDLGKVMEKIFDEKDLGKGRGGYGALTHDVINRSDANRDAFIMALTQFINKDTWHD